MKNYMIIATLLGTMLLAACSDDETLQPGVVATGIPVDFVSKVETRAMNSSFDVNDAIGIYMIKTGTMLSDASVVESTANRHYTTADKSVFAPSSEEETVYFPKDNSTVDFISYYPYTSQPGAGFILPVDVSVQTDQSGIDLLYSNNATGRIYTAPATELVFKHQLVRLHFILKPGKGLTNEQMKGTTVLLKGMNTRADFSLVTGKLDTKVSEADIMALVVTDGETFEAIVLPASGEGKQFIFTVNGEPFYYNLTVDDTLVEGEQYTYNVILNRIENSVTGIIENWLEVERNIEVEP